MRWICTALIAIALPACATLRGLGGDGDREMDSLWREAHTAFARERFTEAEQGFRRLAAEFPESYEGKEATFYIGSLRMDPRNPNWGPDSAAAALKRYLAQDSGDVRKSLPRPEAVVLLELASQLNLPANQRVPELQPTERVVVRPGAPTRVAPASESQALSGEVERLRRQLNDKDREIGSRDNEIRRLRDELERIRKTLVPQRP